MTPRLSMRDPHHSAKVLPIFLGGLLASTIFASASLKWQQPVENAIYQRDAGNRAHIMVSVESSHRVAVRAIEFKTRQPAGQWVMLAPAHNSNPPRMEGSVAIPTGWWQLEARAEDAEPIGKSPAFGVGEVFITVGQSNAANHGKPRQQSKHPHAYAAHWQTGAWTRANDPMPGASGNGGSPWPLFIDALDPSGQIPIGILAVGVGSTAVSQWVPDVAGSHYPKLAAALRHTAPTGCRAILWHQGESDSLAGTTAADYAEKLGAIIARSRVDAGREIPWGIARAAFHPSPAATTERQAAVRKGQMLTISSIPAVFTGPLTDGYRDKKFLSDNVHFNAYGLKAHAEGWVQSIRPLLPEK